MKGRSILGTLIGAVAALALGAQPAASQDVVTEIQNRGVLKVLITNNIPWIYKDPSKDKDKWIGFNVELAELLAEEMKVKLELIEADWATVIPSLLAKKADVILAPMSLTTKRGLVMHMIEPASYGGNYLIVRKGETRFKSYADFNKEGVKFSAFPNAMETMTRSYFPKAGLMIVKGDNPHTPRLEVVAGRVDASMTDAGSAKKFVQENGDKAEIFKGPSVVTTGYHMGVRKEDLHWAQALNTFIQDYRNRGVLKTMGEKWGLQTSANE